MVMNCRNCGAKLGTDDKFCSICGMSTQESEKTTVCDACGTVVENGDRFCPSCGHPVSNDIQQNNLELMRSASSSRLYFRKKRRAFNVKMLLLLMLVLIASAWFLIGTILEWWKL